MKYLKGIATVVLVGVVYQVIAYIITKLLIPLVNIIPPYRYFPEEFNLWFTHMALSWVALLLALYSYPTDLENKHRE